MKKADFKDIKTTHTEHRQLLTFTDLDKFKNKAFSALRLISRKCFKEGIIKMTKDIEKGDCELKELYTYVWGKK